MEQSQFNRMLDKRLRDLAEQRMPGSQSDQSEWSKDAYERLMKACGLFPLPPRTDLNAATTSTLLRDGYRVEKVRFEPRPGVMATGHLYLPTNEGKSPLVISAMTEPGFGKTESWVQAKAIGLALYGFAVLLVDPPGRWFESSFQGERAGMGDAADPALAMGAPAMGVFAWDLIRALDMAERRPEIDASKTAIEGYGYSGIAASLAFALDPRFKACVPVACAGSLESIELWPWVLLNSPHLGAVGDIAHLLALRAPAPVFLVGISQDKISSVPALKKTQEKLHRLYRSHGKEDALRLDVIDAPVDYSRRVREAVYAFLLEHIKGEARRTYAPELRPMTDGSTNPHEAGTEPMHSPELWVTPDWQRNTKTFRDLLGQAMAEPYPDPYQPEDRLAPWTKYGRWEVKVTGTVLRIHDPGEPGPQDSIQLPLGEVEPAKCLAQGVSVAEFFAQLLHLNTPGAPEGWEARAHGADALSAMVASMKTLVGGGSEVQPIASVEALGPVASQAARFFKLFRPDVEVKASHGVEGWQGVIESGNAGLYQPGARYMKWPF